MHGYFQQLDEAGDYSFIFIRRFIGLSNDYHSWLDRLCLKSYNTEKIITRSDPYNKAPFMEQRLSAASVCIRCEIPLLR